MCIPIHICMYTDIHVHMHIRGLALSSLFSFEFWGKKKTKKKKKEGKRRTATQWGGFNKNNNKSQKRSCRGKGKVEGERKGRSCTSNHLSFFHTRTHTVHTPQGRKPCAYIYIHILFFVFQNNFNRLFFPLFVSFHIQRCHMALFDHTPV